MKRNNVKLVLDIVMTIGFVLMFKKNVLGLSFHEIGGIVVCLLFIVHKLLNKYWIITVSKNLFKKETPIKTKIQYIVDILLLIDMIVILFTGIGISKKTFKAIAFLPGSAIPIHFLTGGIGLILVGIHVGLHWKWIKGTAGAKLKGTKNVLLKICGIIVLVAFVCGGAYSFAKSDFKMWMTRAFSSGNGQRIERQMNQGNQKDMPQELTLEHNEERKQEGNSGRQGQGGHPVQKITAGNIAKVFFMFLSMLVLVSTVTAFIEGLISKRQKK